MIPDTAKLGQANDYGKHVLRLEISLSFFWYE